MNNENFEFFWGRPFSQWYKCTIIIDTIKYNCAEQFMMAMKAKTFGDHETLQLILKEKNPRKQKALGRLVKNFKPKEWELLAKDYVYTANLAKFSDPLLKDLLLNTSNKIIVEASPEDCLWGIGLSPDNPDRFDIAKWKGTNWLGEVLMQVRDVLKKQEVPD